MIVFGDNAITSASGSVQAKEKYLNTRIKTITQEIISYKKME